ncbi:MAG: InlB B-repeat-containing protein [Acutalibacteraceae bacterium]|nr:InlB B-repeat-containing protein [Acutalibacteraceae bacterium]
MKKLLSILLVAIMLFTMVPASVFAADGTTVKLVSFMRGDVSDLRSSELLEVQVEGYDGNPRELTYKWTSSLGTYLYIYNSHNMYGINNTYGEYEIYNTDKKISRSSNVEEDRSGNKTLTLDGFMWASVYGAYTYNGGNANSALTGTVKVEVFDKSGKSLGSDSFSSFKAHNLDGDLDNVVIGLFEGDRKNVLDLLGESGIVHITCTSSSVSSADILKGDEHIDIETEKKGSNTYNYFIKGVKAGDNSTNGDAQLEINIKKTSCKFHYNTSGTAEPTVYVFKKPTTTTTTTTLILNKDSIDERCEYFIDGNKGEKQPDGTIVFTGLTPNTDYTVEVRAEYNDNGKTKYVYGYVDDTTKPVYSAKVYTYLDGALTDFENIYDGGAELLVRENNPYTDYISLGKTSTGIYEAPLYNGVFNPYVKAGSEYSKIGNYQLVIEHANAELHLHNYSVKYDTNGGAFKAGEEVGTEIYASGDAVNATSNVPVREGFFFTGWDYSGNTIGSGKQITSSITAPITLKAKWEKAINVTINVTIDHKTENGFDPNPTRTDLDVDFVEMKAGTDAFVETGDKLYFRKDKVTDENGNAKAYTYSIENNKSTYTATDYTYTGLLESSTFGVALSKSGYDVGAIEKKQDKLGNWIINIPLTYNPDDFDLDFSIEMADDVPQELYPDAVIVKVAYWNTETNEWKIISQQETKGAVVKPGVRVDINSETGKGFGSYPVWRFDGDNNPYGYRAVVTGFIYGNSTITVPSESINGKIATYTDGNYTATMGVVADGKNYTALNGAYYNGNTNAQQGTLDGVITVEKYDVTFDANGGKINGGNTYTETDEYYVPDTDDYVPTFDGHEFEGWYKDPEFKEPVTDGEILKENVTFYAKWDQILTGNVRVAGSYLQNGEIVDVWAIDRAESAVVVLQEITQDGAYTVDSQTVKIVWPMSEMVYGISEEYKFTGLDPAKTYRIEVLTLNYGTTYQNSTTVFVNDSDYADDYNTNDYTAVYPENSKWETFVNAYLSFEPASYFQPVEVDATLIGENLRPDDTLVEIWYKATGTDNAYQVISQHTVVPYGIEIAMGKDGMDYGDYGYTVWNSVYDGNLYDYQAYLSKIEKEDAATWPVSVIYGAPSRYSPLNNAPTGVLQVKIIPNRYTIIYNENYEDEGVNVVSYGTHIWSYETAIDYVPVRDGYEFEGWYTNPECTGETVSAIAETVAADTELYAKWKKTSVPTTPVEPLDYVSYTVEHYKENADGTYSIVEEDTEILSGKIGDTVTASANTYEGYCFNVTQSEATVSGILKAISSASDILTLKLYYDIDKIGGGENGDKGDDVSDKYQKKVIFRVVNGTWSDGTSADKVVYLDLMKGGKYAVDGTASLTAPTGMSANEGFKNGSWDAEIPSVVSGTETLVYTYEFVRATTPVEPLDEVCYIVEHYKENTGGTYSIVEEDSEIHIGKIGATVTATVNTYAGYCYNAVESKATSSGVIKAINSASDILTLKLYYDIDKIGGGENGDKGDGTPDKYQKKVIFKVQYGTWSDGTTADKVVYLDLMTNGKYDANGRANLTSPSGMIPFDGFGGGKWRVIPPSIVIGSATETYTYYFEEKGPEYTVEVPDRVTVYEEDSTEIKVEIIPGKDTDGSDLPEVKGYESTDETIAIVDQNGKVTGVKPGTTTVIVTFTDGTQKTVTVVVKEREGIHVVFGKTDGIGWYHVSRDGGKTFETVFGNSTLEVKQGTQLIIKVGDIMGDSFVFYVNGEKHQPDENGQLVVTVNSYMLIGALSVVPEIDFEVPDVDESLNWFQRLIKSIKDFFNSIGDWFSGLFK